MYREITNGIEITVEPHYLEEQSDPEAHRYVWAYTIVIANSSQDTVQLERRHWRITNAIGQTEEVEGEGVVGETPVLSPGDSYQYTSGCPLNTPSGMMIGQYTMRRDDGSSFTVNVPAFSLDLPDNIRTVH
ncbi:Co2+/Mg2+ efflux protein ApaG [Oricola sp.]|uniref:Co2+/Mg2+ efflux protein ApaG n=1 Tax=Oricola sp. TaxID=1979950 RepID=UPI003BA9EB55